MNDGERIIALKNKLLEASKETPFAASDSLIWHQRHLAVVQFAKECLEILEAEEIKIDEIPSI